MPTSRRPGSSLAVVLWLVAAAVIPSSAWAHAGSKLGFATVAVDGPTVRYTLTLPTNVLLSAATGEVPVPPPESAAQPLLDAVRGKVGMSDGGVACPVAAATAAPASGGRNEVVITIEYRCAPPLLALVIRDDLADVFSADYHTMSNIAIDGASHPFMFGADARETSVSVRKEVASGSFTSFFPLGIEHILTGYDHLLFLLALVLRGGRLKSLLAIVTAFTIAHSITLALAALNIVLLPDRLVEATIALSIAYVAAENLLLKRPVSHRWAVSFLFGLMHGFGFSSVLRELGLPHDGLVWSLLGFNLGVETGQAVAVAIILPLLLWLRRTQWEARAVRGASVVVLVVGLGLFVQRALLT